MAIPATIPAAISAFITQVQAAAPLANATQITLAALQAQGAVIVAQIDAALAGAGAPLDVGDPTGFPGAFAADLLALSTATTDQATLSDMHGLVGRALFNIAQAATA